MSEYLACRLDEQLLEFQIYDFGFTDDFIAFKDFILYKTSGKLRSQLRFNLSAKLRSAINA